MKIAVIPIDNRPICYDLIKDILALDDSIELFMPEISTLSGIEKNADIEEIFSFLRSLPKVDYLITALDTIAYGGLVLSRRSEEDFSQIKKRIENFKSIASNCCGKILAFSSIMRISNNNINEEEKKYWSDWGKKIFDWSYNAHLSEDYTNKEIPDEILKDYLNTRERNFKINKIYLSMVQEGFFDTLVFSKDDCAQYGLNIKEANELWEIINNKKISSTYIKTGADEIPLSLICHALAKDNNIKINPVFLEEKSINLISKYEDITVKDCALGQISLAGLKIDTKNPDIQMIINNFKNQQGDLVLGNIINSVEKEINFPDSPFFIADINNANGADSALVKQLLLYKGENFFGYCGYNTSANTIGCSILQAVVKFLALKKGTYSDFAFKKLQFIRLLDDWGYQATSRKYIRESAPNFQQALDEKESELACCADKISNFLKFHPQKITFSLPWNRSFEVRILI